MQLTGPRWSLCTLYPRRRSGSRRSGCLLRPVDRRLPSRTPDHRRRGLHTAGDCGCRKSTRSLRGWEWSVGRLTISGLTTPRSVRVIAGNGDLFRTDLEPGETFDVPPAFLGTYRGDLDDAANSLHKYLLRILGAGSAPSGSQYPRVEWNAFAATGQGQGSWIPTETKYYPLIDDIAPLGFEDVVIDVGWWEGDTTTQPRPPIGNAKLWSRGMRAACDYAHQHGMRFGLYWNHNTSMTTAEGRQLRQRMFNISSMNSRSTTIAPMAPMETSCRSGNSDRRAEHIMPKISAIGRPRVSMR